MGIQQVKSSTKNYYTSSQVKDPFQYLQKSFNIEGLQLAEFLENFWQDSAIAYLDKTNIPENKKLDVVNDREKYLMKQQVVFPEIPLDKQNIDECFDVSMLHEYKINYIPERTQYFSNVQMKKMNLLLIAYVKKILSGCNESDTIECLTKYFDSQVKDPAKFNINYLGVNLFVKLLSDLSKGNKVIKEENLNFMLDNIKFLRPLSFWGNTKQHFSIDKALDTIIDYLKDIIVEPTENEENKIKSLKIMFNLALAKGSLKNLLDVIENYNYIPNVPFDFNYEMNLFKNEFIKLSLSYPDKSNIKLKCSIWNFTLPIEKKTNTAPEIPASDQTNPFGGFGTTRRAFGTNQGNIDNYESMIVQASNTNQNKPTMYYSTTSDGNYIYVFISNGTLIRVGTGYNNTMLGKVYKEKTGYRAGEKGTIAIVDGVLYYRSNMLDPNPVICLDPDTFEEIPIPFDIDDREVNHLWVEGKNNEFEFPHSSYETMMEIIERKKNLGLDERANLRSPASSPMTTDGRYIYIISKWLDDVESNMNKTEDEEDEEKVTQPPPARPQTTIGVNAEEGDNGETKKSKIAIYGVNIYDPLNNMAHVKSIQLNTNIKNVKEIKEEKDTKSIWKNDQPNNPSEYNSFLSDNQGQDFNQSNDMHFGNQKAFYLPSNFLMNQNQFYTNGNILIINGYKFSLVTGDLLEKNITIINLIERENKDRKNYSAFCYDLSNNLIWGINKHDVLPTLSVTSYFNKSAKPIAEYPKNHPNFYPCSTEKIIKYCEENISFSSLGEESSVGLYKKETTLNILGLEDEKSKKYKSYNLINKSDTDKEKIMKYKTNIQCLILNTIAKLSEFYGQVPDLRIANTDIERGQIFAQILRAPFCIKLEPIVFEKLIKFLNHYSKTFLDDVIHKKSQANFTDAYCLLAIIKIIRTNLFCLSKSGLDVKMFEHSSSSASSSTTFSQMKEFVLKILEIYTKENIGAIGNNDESSEVNNVNEVIKSLYNECKIIFEVSVHTLYADNLEILKTLEDNISQFNKSQYARDVVKCILTWMSNEDNMKSMLVSMTKEEDFRRIFEIFNNVSKWEIDNIKKYLTSNEENYNEHFREIELSEDEKTAFKFAYALQIEIIKKLSKNLLDDHYENIENEKIVMKFTKILFNDVNEIFSLINNYLSRYVINLEKEYSRLTAVESDDMIDTTVPQGQKPLDEKTEEMPTLKDFMKNKFATLYKNLMDKLVCDNSLIMKIYLLHINSLSIISSDYILAAYLQELFTPILNQMNAIHSTFSTYIFDMKSSEEVFVPNSDYNEVVVESEHPFPNNITKTIEINLPNEKPDADIYFEFDPQSNLGPAGGPNGNGYLSFFSDKKRTRYAFPKNTQITASFPKTPLVLKKNKLPVFLYIYSNTMNTEGAYGFKLTVHNGKDRYQKVSVQDNFFKMYQTTSWVGCKCASVLIKGNFMKVATSDDDDKYTNAINSRLFSGGVGYDEIRKENDTMIKNIVSIFDGIEKEKGETIRDKEKKNYAYLLNDKRCVEVIKIFQQKYAKCVPGGNVGGEKVIKLVTCAFLCFLHHSGEMEKFVKIVESEKKEDEITKDPSFENLYKKYVVASQMRAWLIEKKKNVDEAIEKQKSKNEDDSEENHSETIIKKIIDQTIYKAKFLLKINPTVSLQGEENFENLKTSILPILKSNLSSRKLFKKVKVATLRALGRFYGISMITNIFKVISNGELLQDLLCWFCTAFRSSSDVKNNFAHYLDNVSGCGKFYEILIKNAFQTFISILIEKYIQNTNPKELESFIDTLLWRYGADDHQFLYEKGVFNILWGTENEIMRNVWGKSINPRSLTKENTPESLIEKQMNMPFVNLTNEVLEIFEILSNICLSRIIEENNSSSNENDTATLGLVKKQSKLNESNTYSLITSIINVIFGEIDKAVNSYYRYRGISHVLWKQYERMLIEKEDKEDEKKKEKEKPAPTRGRYRRQYSYDEECDYEEEYEDEYDEDGNVIIPEPVPKKVEPPPEEPKKEEENKNFYFYKEDLIDSYDDLIQFYIKVKTQTTPQSQSNKKTMITESELLSYIKYQMSKIYDNEFLNRILQILYKISIQNNPQIMKLISSSEYIYNIIRLITFCSSENKYILSKALLLICPMANEEILNDVVELYNDNNEDIHYDNFIELLLGITCDIRRNSWVYGKEESSSAFVVSNILVEVIRKLKEKGLFKELIESIIKSAFDKIDTSNHLRRELIVAIMGGDFYGMTIGGIVRVPSTQYDNTIKFDFVKSENDDEDKLLLGSVLCFANSFGGYFNIKEKKAIVVITQQGLNGGRRAWNNNANAWNVEKKKEVETTKEPLYLNPNNSNDCLVAVLQYDSLSNSNGEFFKLSEINPKIYNQYEVIPYQKKIDFDKLIVSDSFCTSILDFYFDNKYNSTSQDINLKTDITRFIMNFSESKKGMKLLMNYGKFGDSLKFFVNKATEYLSNASINHSLELLEEKRYRLLTYTNENKESLSDSEKISLTFMNSNAFSLRVVENTMLMSICYNVIKTINIELIYSLCYGNYEKIAFASNKDVDNVKIIFIKEEKEVEAILGDKNFNNNIIMITSLDIFALQKSVNTIIKVKNSIQIALIQISPSNFKDIESIYADTIIKKDTSLIFADIQGREADFSKDKVINELVNDFGFKRELVIAEIEKADNLNDINSIISSLLEASSLNKMNEEVEEVKEKEQIDKNNCLELEKDNECFMTKDDELKVDKPSFFEDLFISSLDNKSLLFEEYKKINLNIQVMHSRRILLSLLENSLNYPEEFEFNKIFSDIPNEKLLNTIKLITQEGLFINLLGLGNELLYRIKKIIIKLLSSADKRAQDFINYVIEQTRNEINKVVAGDPIEYEYIKNDQEVISTPFIFFDIWIMMINNEYSKAFSFNNYYQIINSLSGLVTIIKANKEIRWLVLDLLIQLCHTILNALNTKPDLVAKELKEKEFKSIPNVQYLLSNLIHSIRREGAKYLSKRSQMICELMLLIYTIDKKIIEQNEKDKEESEAMETVKSKKYDYLFEKNISKNENFIKDLLCTYSIMQNFFNTNFLKYLAWIEFNPEITTSFSRTYESSHLYSKVPHSFLINFPNTNQLMIEMNEDSYFDESDALTFSCDKENEIPLACYVSNATDKKYSINSSYAFVNFPSKYLTEVYAFGSNTSSRLGSESSGDITTPKLIQSLSNIKVKEMSLGDSCTLALTDNGEIYSCGSGQLSGVKSSSPVFTKDNCYNKGKVLEKELISSLTISGSGLIIATQGNALYSFGSNTSGRLGQMFKNSIDEITKINGFSQEVKCVSMSESHTMILTKKNEVYHLGKNDFFQNGDTFSGRNNTPKKITFPKDQVCQMLSVGEDYTLFLMKNTQTGKTTIFSAGNTEKGRTGRGQKTTNYLEQITCNTIENVDFKYVRASKFSSAAISVDGKLYTWGCNSSGQLGHGTNTEITEPTLVKFFEENYEVEDIKMDIDFSIVLAKEKSTGKKYVFGMGDESNGKLGELVTGKGSQKTLPTRIKFFDDKNPLKIFVGCRGTVVICKSDIGVKAIKKYNINCDGCKKEIIGTLLYDYEQKKKLCENCEDKTRKYLLIKSPIKDITLLQNIPTKIEFEECKSDIICEECKEKINPALKEPFYTYQHNAKEVKFLCDFCMNRYPSCVTNIKIYVKSRDYSVILSKKSIDNINEINYYDSSVGYGYKFTVRPIFDEIGCETIIKKYSESFKAFCEELNNYNKPEQYEQLVDLLNEMAQKANKSIFSYSFKDLVFKKEQLSVRTAINKCSNESLKKMFVVLKMLNEKIKDLLPYIDFSKTLQNNQRLSAFYNKITPLIFWEIKNDIIKSHLENTSVNVQSFDLKINRMKVKKFIEKGVPDHLGEHTIFGQMFQHLRQYSFKIFRKKEGGNSCKIFNVQFLGEASIDAGGPYRECISQAIGELQSPALPLLIQSPNQKNEAGTFREKWIVNPGSCSASHIEMYEILGGLIGYAMRTGEFLNMDLPSIFWKSLLEVPLDRKDLEKIDKYAIQCLEDIMHSSQESFSAYSDQKFTTILSNGTEVEVCPNGKNISLTYENRALYCELTEKTRLNEGRVQMQAIRSGLEKVIPIGLLKLVSWSELEMLVCGKPILDIELLKENTKYRGCSETDPVVQFFWKCLEEFTAEERSMYLRFVWGRSRLPLTSKDFHMSHRIEIIHHAHPDLALPQSHTCFFSLEIPKYSSYEILKEKLKYAITHCQAIDTDGNAQEVWDDEE